MKLISCPAILVHLIIIIYSAAFGFISVKATLNTLLRLMQTFSFLSYIFPDTHNAHVFVKRSNICPYF